MNCLKTFYIQQYTLQGTLVDEQNICKIINTRIGMLDLWAFVVTDCLMMMALWC